MILYFSGTGNSRHVAKRMAAELDDQLLDLNERIKAEDTSPVETGEDLVVVTPTYAWRIPRLVRDWLLNTRMAGAKRVWFVMTCGSEIGSAAGYNRAFARPRAWPAWERCRSLCRRIISPCFTHPRWRKLGRLWPGPNRALMRLSPPSGRGGPLPPPGII